MGFSLSDITKPFKQVWKETKRLEKKVFGKIERELKRVEGQVEKAVKSIIPKMPEIPPFPKPVDISPRPREVDLEGVKAEERKRLDRRRGYMSTVLTRGATLGTALTQKARALGV